MSEGTSKRGEGRASKVERGSKRARRSKGEPSLSRRKTLGKLDEILDLCFEKLMVSNTSNTARQRWSRIAIQAIQASTPILKDFDLDDLKVRIEALEKARKVS